MNILSEKIRKDRIVNIAFGGSYYALSMVTAIKQLYLGQLSVVNTQKASTPTLIGQFIGND